MDADSGGVRRLPAHAWTKSGCWSTSTDLQKKVALWQRIEQRLQSLPAAHAMKHITFYLDFISPYAYLAFEELPEALKGLSYR